MDLCIDEIASIRLRKGILSFRTQSRFAHAQEYKAKKAPSQKAKTVLIEHPLESDWHLIAAQGTDRKDPRPLSVCRRC